MATVHDVLKDDLKQVRELANQLGVGLKESGDLHDAMKAADRLSTLADDLAGRIESALEALGAKPEK